MTTTTLTAGPEMDHAVAARVLSMTYEPRFAGDVAGYYRPPGIEDPIISEEMPAYSTDLGAAAAVLDWLRSRGHILVVSQEGGWCCQLVLGPTFHVETGATLPEAICRLALAVAENGA